MSGTYDRISKMSVVNLGGTFERRIRCVDMHTGGEPLRVILNGLPNMDANTVLDYRQHMLKSYDNWRTFLMWEPRGHADMYGAILLPPERQDSDFGVLFLHNEGYSTMCGHATIAIAKLAVECGWIEHNGQSARMKIDAPCGQLSARVDLNNGTVSRTSFDNVPSFVVDLDAEVFLENGVKIKYDLAFGGAFYAYINASEIGLDLTADNYSKLIDWGRSIKGAIQKSRRIDHPFESDLSFLYGTIFIQNHADPAVDSKNVCIFADGELDRSPTGSGISGRAAIYEKRNELGLNTPIKVRSLIDSEMSVEIVEKTQYGPFEAVIPRVSGDAWITGFHEFVLEKDDPFPNGFFLR